MKIVLKKTMVGTLVLFCTALISCNNITPTIKFYNSSEHHIRNVTLQINGVAIKRRVNLWPGSHGSTTVDFDASVNLGRDGELVVKWESAYGVKNLKAIKYNQEDLKNKVTKGKHITLVVILDQFEADYEFFQGFNSIELNADQLNVNKGYREDRKKYQAKILQAGIDFLVKSGYLTTDGELTNKAINNSKNDLHGFNIQSLWHSNSQKKYRDSDPERSHWLARETIAIGDVYGRKFGVEYAWNTDKQQVYRDPAGSHQQLYKDPTRSRSYRGVDLSKYRGLKIRTYWRRKIQGREYSLGAISTMSDELLMPAQLEHTMATGTSSQTTEGFTAYEDDFLKVVVDVAGKVHNLYRAKPKGLKGLGASVSH